MKTSSGVDFDFSRMFKLLVYHTCTKTYPLHRQIGKTITQQKRIRDVDRKSIPFLHHDKTLFVVLDYQAEYLACGLEFLRTFETLFQQHLFLFFDWVLCAKLVMQI